MSDQDQQQASGQEQSPRETSPQGERGGGGRRGDNRRRRRPHASQQQHTQGHQQQQRHADSLLNMTELRELAELFSSHGLTDFEFENADIRVRLSRNAAPPPQQQASAAHAAQHAPTAQAAGAQSGAVAAPQAASAAPPAGEPAHAEEAGEELHIITSPIVGTFYRAPSPNAESFVRVGSAVGPDSVVCIIEAMKLMNEIQAEVAGTIEKIYVENGQPVEYGQPLFGVKK